MSIDLFDPYGSVLITIGTIVLAFGNIGVVVLESRWQPSLFRFEREVMTLTALAIGPVGMLALAGLPLDETDGSPLPVYLCTGMLIFLLQTLFVLAWRRLRAHRRAEQAVLKAADA